MSQRRKFIKNGTLATAGLLMSDWAMALFNPLPQLFISKRPALKDRKFTSKAVEAKILAVKKLIKDEEFAWLFENCYPNTLDTTVTFRKENGKPFTYVITGDIDAMWLRDSSAQVWPYLTLVKEDEALKELIAGVINQQAAFVNIDPYANAFYDDPSRISPWQHDNPDTKPGVHERKWELDSLCYVIRLAHGYWKATGDTSLFDAEWVKAMKLIVSTFKMQQRKNDRGNYRWNGKGEPAADNGYGRPVKPTGLIYSMFRPSDDPTRFPFLIPSNLIATVSLQQLAEIFSATGLDAAFAKEAGALADEVHKAILKNAVENKEGSQKVLAYEIDGFGSVYFADDANVPSLLSLPYIGAIKRNDPLYISTRKYLLNEKTNPYYAMGKAGEGVSSPHIGKDMIWPMAIILRAITSTDDKEILAQLKTLKATHAGKGFMHESFFKDDATKYTRDWFAWANTLFGELVVKLAEEKPYLLALV